MRSIFIAAVLMALLANAPASAREPNNMRLLVILHEGASFAIDGERMDDLDGDSVNFYTMTPGAHFFSLTTESGASVSLTTNLNPQLMSTARGRSWWCLVAARRHGDNKLVMVLATPAQCDSILAAAPEKDDPDDYDPAPDDAN
jgi:hypothetical protein